MNFEDYYSTVPEQRRARIEAIRECFVSAVDDVHETLHYKMPTFEKGGNCVYLANQKHYIAVYFCDKALVSDFRRKHPELDIGKGCVRIRDTQAVPLGDLKDAFVRAIDS